MRRSEEFGIEKEGMRVNFQRVRERMQKVQAKIGKGDDPELGWVRLTEAEAKEEYGGKNIQVHRFYFNEVDRAIMEGEEQGMVKLFCNKKKRY